MGLVAVMAARSTSGMDAGVLSKGIDLYEELTCDGEKPLTTLVVLRSEVQLTELADSAELSGAVSEAEELFSTEGVEICGEGADVCFDFGCVDAMIGATGAR